MKRKNLIISKVFSALSKIVPQIYDLHQVCLFNNVWKTATFRLELYEDGINFRNIRWLPTSSEPLTTTAALSGRLGWVEPAVQTKRYGWIFGWLAGICLKCVVIMKRILNKLVGFMVFESRLRKKRSFLIWIFSNQCKLAHI